MDTVLETTKYFTKQCRQALEDTQSLNLAGFQKIKNICVCSMGASSFGYYVVKALFNEELAVPIILNSDYSLPGSINQDSLVFFSSYSGYTEEPVSCFQKAIARKTKITGITKDQSTLGSLFLKNHIPFYKLIPDYNPSDQPRMATGYMIIGFIGMLQKMKLLNNINNEILSALDFIDNKQEEIEEQARRAASRLSGRQIIIIAGSHLAGNAHILRNQFNESSKNFSDYFILPELNHHMMESLAHPNFLKDTSLFLSFNSSMYSAKISLRLDITKDIIKKNNIDFVEVNAKGETKIKQVLYLISFGGFLSYYLALLNKEDPSKIPWVDFFKSKLSVHDKE